MAVNLKTLDFSAGSEFLLGTGESAGEHARGGPRSDQVDDGVQSRPRERRNKKRLDSRGVS